MAAPFNDVIKEIPGYKIILKSVLKAQIQHLVEQLATDTDEESVILTANVSDGTLSHLGSESGKDFLRDHEDIKLQFLGFCLKGHYEKRHFERQSQETFLHDSSENYVNNFGDDNEIYTATAIFPQTTCDSIHNAGPKLLPYRSPERSSGVRFEPYMSPKRSDKYVYNLQGQYKGHVFGQSVFNVPKKISSEENAYMDESSKVVESTEEICENPLSQPNLKTNSYCMDDPTLNKNDNTFESDGKINKIESKSREFDKISRTCHENSRQEQNGVSNEATENVLTEDNPQEDNTSLSTSTNQYEVSNTRPAKTNQNRQALTETIQVKDSRESLRLATGRKYQTMDTDLQKVKEEIKTHKDITIRKSKLKEKLNGNTKEISVLQNAGKGSYNTSAEAYNTGDRNLNIDNSESYVSRLRSSRALKRKYEVNNALKLSKARQSFRRGTGRHHRGRISRSLRNIVSSSGETSVANTESECDNSELQQSGKSSSENKKGSKIFPPYRGNEEKMEQKRIKNEKESSQSKHIKQETNSDSESELEITWIEPGSVFVFKETLSKVKTSDDTSVKQRKVFTKRGRKPGRKTKNKCLSTQGEQAVQTAKSYVTKLRRYKLPLVDEKQRTSKTLNTSESHNEEAGDSQPTSKLANFDSDIENSARSGAKKDKINGETESETEVPVNEDETTEAECLDQVDSDSYNSNQSNTKENVSHGHSIDEDTPSPVSLSNSNLESEDCNDEMTSDSSTAFNCYSEFAAVTHQTDHNPVSNKVITNVNDTFERHRSELDINHIEPSRTDSNKDKWESKICKKKKLVSCDSTLEEGIRLAKQRHKHSMKKIKCSKKDRKSLKIKLKPDPEMYRYSVASTVAKLRNSLSNQNRNQIPAMVFTKFSLDSGMKSLSLYNDRKSSRSSSSKSKKECQEHYDEEQKHAFDQQVSQGNEPEQRHSSSSEKRINSGPEQNQGSDLERKHFSLLEQNQACRQNEQGLAEKLSSTVPLAKPDNKCVSFQKHNTRNFSQPIFDRNCSFSKDDRQMESDRKYKDVTGIDEENEENAHNLTADDAMTSDESNNVIEDDVDSSCYKNHGKRNRSSLSNIFDIIHKTSETNVLLFSTNSTVSKSTEVFNAVAHSNGITGVSYKQDYPSVQTKIDRPSCFQKEGSACPNTISDVTSFKQSVLNIKVEDLSSEYKGAVSIANIESPLPNLDYIPQGNDLCRQNEELQNGKYFDTTFKPNSITVGKQENNMLPFHLRLRAESPKTAIYNNCKGTENDLNSSPSVSLSFSADTVSSSSQSSSSPLTSFLSLSKPSSSSMSLSTSATLPYSLFSSPSSVPPISIFSSPSSLPSSLYPQAPASSIPPKPFHENNSDCYSSNDMMIKKEPCNYPFDSDNQNDSVLQKLNKTVVLNLNDLKHRASILNEEPEISQTSSEEISPSNITDGSANLKTEEQLSSECMLNSKYTCDTCDEVFQFKYLLTDHMKIHTGENDIQFKVERDVGNCAEGERDMGNRVGGERDMGNRVEGERDMGNRVEGKRDMGNLVEGERDMGNRVERERDPSDLARDELRVDEQYSRTVTQKSAVKGHVERNYHFKTKKKRFPKKYTMENRTVFHSKKPKRFICTQCGRKYRLKMSLEKHINIHHTRTIITSCQICGLDYTRKTVSNDTIYAGRASSDKVNCNKFVIKSQNDASICEKCKYFLKPDTDSRAEVDLCKQTTNSASYNNIAENDTEKDTGGSNIIGTSKSRECDLCEKTFSSENSLKIHVHTAHYGELFKCKKCRKTFSKEESFKIHIEESHEHKNENAEIVPERKSSLHCGACGLPFSGSKQLRIHKNIVHSKKLFKCRACKRAFSYKRCLKRHVEALHSQT